MGNRIGTMLDEAFGNNTDVKQGGMSKTMRVVVQSYLQTLFNTTARDLGVTPEQVFNDYGPSMFLSPADATHTAQGKLKIVSDRAKALFLKSLRNDQQSFSQDRVAKQNARSGLRAIATMLTTKKSVPNAMTYNGIPVDFDYGYEGDSRIDARGRRKGEHGFLHLLEARWRKDGLSEEEIRILLDDLVYTIAYGKPTIKSTAERTVLNLGIHGGTCVAVLSKDGNRNTWVLTGYYLNPTTGAATQGSGKSSATQSGPTPPRSRSGAVATDSLTILEQSVLTSKALRQIALKNKQFSPIQPRHLPQGSIGDWFPTVRAIALWAGANRSTFLHETGHMFLDMRVRIAQDLALREANGEELTTGQKHLLDSARDVLKWLGTDIDSFLKMSVDEQRPMHEKFARTYEAYVMESNAPSRSLTKVFRAFSGWLRGVYRAIANIPGAEINPEVRELFDNLLVAFSEVEMARQRRAQFEMFSDPNQAAIALEVGEDFAELQKESADTAVEEMQRRLAKASRRQALLRKGEISRLTRYAQQIYRKISDEEWDNLVRSKVYQAYIALAQGINGVEPKLTNKDIASLEPKLTEAQIKFLQDNDMIGSNKRGVSALMVAQQFGYASVNEMVADILNMGDPLAYVKAATAERMLEEYPNIAAPESIEHMADAAIFNDARLRILSIEAMAFNKALGKTGDVLRSIKAGARRAVGLIRLSELKYASGEHASNSARNARECDEARKNGDIRTAAAAKIRELYQAALVRMIEIRSADIEKAFKFFNRFKGLSCSEPQTQ